ncbi:MAG: hypothetical protein ACRYG7_11560 [Janthinobacterium lividum]
MDPYATYTAHTGRWLVTLAIGLAVLATAYSRALAPAWYWAMPPTDAALASSRQSYFFQPLIADSQIFLPANEPWASTPATGRRPAGAWHPVALWLTAGGSLGGLPAHWPEAGWPLATNQVDELGTGRAQSPLAARRRLVSAAGPLREE